MNTTIYHGWQTPEEQVEVQVSEVIVDHRQVIVHVILHFHLQPVALQLKQIWVYKLKIDNFKTEYKINQPHEKEINTIQLTIQSINYLYSTLNKFPAKFSIACSQVTDSSTLRNWMQKKEQTNG